MEIARYLIAFVAVFNFGGLVAEAIVPLFPVTAWMDPQLAASIPRPLGLAPQQLITYIICGMVILAILIAVSV